MADVPIDVVGLVGGECFGAAARDALACATVVVGSDRHVAQAACPPDARHIAMTGALGAVFDAITDARAHGERVCVLASGDPGFFGIVRSLSARFGSRGLRVHPAPSSVALAFARLGLNWDDAQVVSAHGRELGDALGALRGASKAAVLCSPENPPERIAASVSARGAHRQAIVLTRLGEPDEDVRIGRVDEIARGTFDPMSVLVLAGDTNEQPTLVWGAPESGYAHRDGMITKAEVRAVAISKLRLPRRGVLWDVGAGSGSVGIECAHLCPALRVVAVEHDPESAQRIAHNAHAHGVEIDVVEGRAPEALTELASPDRVFVGGGGIDVLDVVLARLQPGGVVVATYAVLDRAVAAWHRLGNLCEVSVARGRATGELGVRLEAQHPVFVAWNEPQ
jgi:precorrin-6Y C5,15-methyltransferase (decarboxylating)